jgi:hypothetical protein
MLTNYEEAMKDLTNYKQAILVETQKDLIDVNKNKGFTQLKNEEIARVNTSMKEIKTGITDLKKKITETLTKIKETTDPALIKDQIAILIELENKAESKTDLLVNHIDRLRKAEGELKGFENNVSTTENFKRFKDNKYNEIKLIYDNFQKNVHEIKTFVDLKKENSKHVELKTNDYANHEIKNPIIEILNSEKLKLNERIKTAEVNNITLEKRILELNKSLTEQTMKNTSESQNIKDFSNYFISGKALTILDDSNFVGNNCTPMKEFASKVNNVCVSIPKTFKQKIEPSITPTNTTPISPTNTNSIPTSTITKRDLNIKV